MSTVGYIVRDMAGTKQHGSFAEGTNSSLNATHSKDISLNLSPSDVESYSRRGNALHIKLASGETLVLEGFYQTSTTGGKNLFLSEEGQFIEVILEDRAEGMLFATYEPLDLTGKWSAYDDLVFLDVDRIEPVIAPLVAAPLFGGIGAAGAAGAAVLGGAALLGGGGGGGGAGVIIPTVNDPDAEYPIGGTGPSTVQITGTGEPGSEVIVDIGGNTQTVTVGDDGNWTADFPAGSLPGDGVYDSVVTVTNPGGTVYDLDGPTVDIDTTAPTVEITAGTQFTGDVVNATAHSSGPVITGTGEPGATVTLEIEGTTHSTTVAADGSWSIAFASGEISTGEHSTTITITTTDARGNSTTTTDTLVVDTVAPTSSLNTVETDDVVNAAEASDGVLLSGNSEAGATLQVTFQGTTQTVTADASGFWSAAFAASTIAAGEYDADVTIVATDAYGNSSTTTETVHIDTVAPSVVVTSGTQASGTVVNAAAHAAGPTITGTGEPGATVSVEIQGTTHATTVAADGSWSVAFAASEISTGEHSTAVTITTTDVNGNSSTSSDVLVVDTVAPPATLNTVEGDDVINAAEASDGVILNGFSEPGATLQVTFQGTTQTVTADVAGFWNAAWTAANIRSGEYDSTVTIVATDAHGNSTTTTETVRVDTTTSVTMDSGLFGGDSTVNASERGAGITLTGTAEPGATVMVQLGAVSRAATVDASGNWSADFVASDIPVGTYNSNVTVTSTDAAGNTQQVTSSLRVDTEVTPLTSDPNQTANDLIDSAEHAAGVTLSGTAEAGSTVSVAIQGTTRAATVDALGNWTVTFDSSDIARGEYTANAVITATDGAGNVRTLTESFVVDTEVSTPEISTVTFAGNDVDALRISGLTDNYTITALQDNDTTTTPGLTQSVNPTRGTEFTFNSLIPDGTHLVISAQDTVGNRSSTMLVLEDNATNAGTLDHAGLAGFNIDAIDLEYAADTNLVLDEARIRELSGETDRLTIHGDNNDTVTISGATNTGVTQVIDGQTYNVYTIGTDGTSVVIDQEINVVI